LKKHIKISDELQRQKGCLRAMDSGGISTEESLPLVNYVPKRRRFWNKN